jgi:hypothetical protein
MGHRLWGWCLGVLSERHRANDDGLHLDGHPCRHLSDFTVSRFVQAGVALRLVFHGHSIGYSQLGVGLAIFGLNWLRPDDRGCG